MPNSITKTTKRVLVVSDNFKLLKVALESLKDASKHSAISYTSRYSSVNEEPDQLSILGASALNLNDQIQVDWAIRNFDLIFSIHCKQIFPSDLVSNVQSINFHPGFNPFNRGWFPQAFSIMNGMPAGVTVHVMDSEVDHGAIICQQTVPIESWETSLEVYEKVINAEIELIKSWVPTIIDGNFPTVKPDNDGNYNSIKDFQNLCKLDLDQIGTLKEHINLLRALSHGDFQNAFFIAENGEKISVSVSFTKMNKDN